MPPDTKTLLDANALIHAHGDDAEEHATTRLWAARQAKDDTAAAKWLAVIEALNEVRALRKQV